MKGLDAQGRPVTSRRSRLQPRRLDVHIVNYADDFVICCRGTAEQAAATMRNTTGRLTLTANEAKPHICCLPYETFDFLGYTIGRCCSLQTGRAYLGTRRSCCNGGCLELPFRLPPTRENSSPV